MIDFIRRSIPDTHPVRLFYHRILAILAAILYRFPAEKLHVIAVTGTKGKTTTSNLIAHILETAGHKVGLTSTILFKIDKKVWVNQTKQTTLSPFRLQGLLRAMVKAGCSHAVIETSSHAMTQSRLWGVNVDMAVLTNISQDHIEYHGSFRKYVEAKGRLFSHITSARRKMNIPKIAVLNRDIQEFDYFNDFVPDRILTYGFSKKATYTVEKLKLEAHGSHFTLKVPNDSVEVHFHIPGAFNVANALAAATAAIGLSIKLSFVREALESAKGFPGRLENIWEGQDFTVIVDYAHTTESLEEVCKLFKEFASSERVVSENRLSFGRFILVFGATGGGRDKAKRPKMGEVAHRYADEIILTNDDPYDEDEYAIIEQIASGISRKEGEHFWKIVDRVEAIRFALQMAEKGDIILIAGKGSETVLIRKGKKIPHDDRQIARRILQNLSQKVVQL